MTNMYEWITEKNINPLRGRCLHECSYCYALNSPRPGMKLKYSGPIMLDEKVLKSKVSGGTRFLCSCNDLFAEGVKEEYITDIINWAARQKTTWAVQTKNPKNELFLHLIKQTPDNFLVGTTIETNRDTSEFSKAPHPKDRVVKGLDYVTIEPIMDFDLLELVEMIKEIEPRFINIGADSRPPRQRDLPEPSKPKVLQLIQQLEQFTEVRQKKNLKRILDGVK